MTTNQGYGRPPHGRAGDGWRIARACLVVGGVIVASIVLSAALVGLVLPPEAMTGGPLGQPSRQATWASLICFQALTSALILAFVSWRSPGRVGFTFALGPPQAGTGTIARIFTVFVLVQAAFTWFSFTFFYDDVLRDLGLFRQMIVDTPLWVAVIALVIGAPVSEELLFRGFLMNRLSQTRLGYGGAAIVATTGWTLLHVGYSTIGLVEVFLAGLLFSWALWRTGSLWVPMAFHAFYNAVVLWVIVSLPAPVGV